MSVKIGKVEVKESFKVFIEVDPMLTHELQEKLGQGYVSLL